MKPEENQNQSREEETHRNFLFPSEQKGKKDMPMDAKKPEPEYANYWRNFMLLHNLAGMVLGGLIGSFFGAVPTGAFLGLIAGLFVADQRAFRLPCDLTDWQIALLDGVITPLRKELVEPDSIDVTLADEFHQIQPDGTAKTIKADEIIIAPGECWLAHTQETFAFPANLKGTLQGKSSWARLSLFVECAGLFDKGFVGTAVLELHNAGTWGILLRKGDRIAQMSFHRTLKAAAPYGSPLRQSHYQKQEGARESWLAKNERIKPA
jgi:deoxycytidine triphosphate deaminase